MRHEQGPAGKCDIITSIQEAAAPRGKEIDLRRRKKTKDFFEFIDSRFTYTDTVLHVFVFYC
jgi:hypothetical protein